jgi:arylsulfatase A-like enzyme
MQKAAASRGTGRYGVRWLDTALDFETPDACGRALQPEIESGVKPPHSIFLLLAALALVCGCASAVEVKERPNVLFIAVDDLNHWVGHLGRNPQTKTPNIDRLARMGVTFANAHCAAPVCNPSRAALMSGKRPGQTGVYDNGQDWRPVIPKEETLTTQFLKAGYDVFGAGKIYHSSVHREGEWTDYFRGGGVGRLKRHESAKDGGVGVIQFYPLANDDADMPDYRVASYGIEKLKARHDKPFFLALGFVKPHMPFAVPKKYFDRFPLENIQLPPTITNDLADVPAGGLYMNGNGKLHAKLVASGRWKEAVQAYLASIAFLDAQVGRVLDALDKSAYRDNTIIVFFGDHGWHLGEKEHWRKFALWEEATRAPFIWVAPRVTKRGGVCARPVDFMAIYPTLLDLCRIPIPKHITAESIRPLLRDPKVDWSNPAITTFKRNNHAIRTERWRYIRYADGGEELYDHNVDPYEWTNVVSRADYAATKAELAKWLPRENVATVSRR